MTKRDDKLEKMLADCIKAISINLHESKDLADKDAKAMVLSAAVKMYKETKDEVYKTFIINSLDTILANAKLSDVVSPMVGEALFFANDKTENEKYKDAAIVLANEVMSMNRNDAGVFVDKDSSEKAELSDAYEKLPFYMTYETKLGGKEHYNDIISQFRAVRAAGRCEKCGLYNESSDLDAALYMASLIDTMEAADQPVYEIFAGIKDIYKETLAALIANSKFNTTEYNFVTVDNLTEKLIMAYSVMKGCRMKAILTSKYEKNVQDIIVKAFAIAKNMDKNELIRNNLLLAALMMSYAESIKERSYQEYGRNKGGALWS